MNSRVLVVGLIAIVVFGTFLFKGKEDDSKVVQEVGSSMVSSDENTSTTLESKVKRMGVVDVEIIPLQLEVGKEAIFELTLNTHSVELDYDFTNIVSLKDDLGNEYIVNGWSGEIGGHHLGGELTAEVIKENANSVSLTIDGIDNSEATFEWKLQ